MLGPAPAKYRAKPRAAVIGRGPTVVARPVGNFGAYRAQSSAASIVTVVVPRASRYATKPGRSQRASASSCPSECGPASSRFAPARARSPTCSRPGLSGLPQRFQVNLCVEGGGGQAL